MNVMIIDGHGGGMGKLLVGAVKKRFPNFHVVAVGTNSAATAAMHKAGADETSTGENALIVNCRRTQVIIGPLGIVIADSLGGEITPAMAVAAAQSRATRILIPLNRCDNVVAGMPDMQLSDMLKCVLDELQKLDNEPS